MVGCNNYEMLRDKCIIQADGFQSSPRIITADEWVKDGGDWKIRREAQL